MRLVNLQEPAYACTAVALQGLTPAPAFDKTGAFEGWDFEKWKRSVVAACGSYDAAYRDARFDNDYSNKSLKKMAIVIAFTVDTSPSSLEMLEKLGFTRASPFIEKLKHPENMLSLWWMRCQDFIEAAGYEPEHVNNGKDA